ncbi:Chondroitin beta-1,4-N-acetylgalactosaminyltransferase, putative [Pediculus humanus corporis]|uniref:Hexosyltransferase n=1 Tax=Pediculus humanus subsp. corporis TaxID=121224 RepID=E0W114_PEDHC|nr:Chondroitin beta-1,4-N-acetylgalactosaminyltransferase, putative [Pediculus humanus corporis]EEB19320.1 Chondroitin beta-1,4-N-acetylgalactosaminyltransferase, putative [Pediculus humanus corporis]
MQLFKCNSSLFSQTPVDFVKLYNYSSSSSSLSYLTTNDDDCSLHVKKQIESAELTKGVPLNNEYEIIPFTQFTLNRIHPVDLSLGKRVVEKPIGYKRKDLTETLFKALESLNIDDEKLKKTNKRKSSSLDNKNPRANVTNGKKYKPKFNNNNNNNNNNNKYGLEDFVEGLYRIDPTTGTQYELYFRDKNNLNNNNNNNLPNYVKVILMRPFAELAKISVTDLPFAKRKELVHVILPLSGRTNMFRSFMDKFVKIGLKNDKRVHLTVVYFGEEGLSEARNIMSKIVQQKGNGRNSLRLLALNETFSRAKGLRVGAERVWDDGDDGGGGADGGGGENKTKGKNVDALLFMCDVDIIFSSRFLDRCRWNAKPKKQVYYPIVFSLYNPNVVYKVQGKEIPSETDQLIVSRDTGYWRDFGFGMTCQYRSDFFNVKGFDEDVVGWGGEDVNLYRKYVKSDIKVVRATDPGIFHIWHPKVCSSNAAGQQLSPDQYKSCIRSKALNEASHAQLGFLAFKDEITKNYHHHHHHREHAQRGRT